MMRCLTLALIVLGLMLVANAIVNSYGPPAFRAILAAISAASYVTFSLSVACAYTGMRGLLVLLVAVVIVSIIPASIAALAQHLAPIGMGILLGVAARRLVPSERKHALHGKPDHDA